MDFREVDHAMFLCFESERRKHLLNKLKFTVSSTRDTKFFVVLHNIAHPGPPATLFA